MSLQQLASHANSEELHLQLEFRNDSKFYKAENHVVMLTSLWKWKNNRYEKEEYFEPIRLKPLGYGPETILPHMRVFAPFGRISSVDYQKRFEKNLLSGNPEHPHFRFEMKDMPRWILSHVEPGKHQFEITVFFDNIPPVSKRNLPHVTYPHPKGWGITAT